MADQSPLSRASPCFRQRQRALPVERGLNGGEILPSTLPQTTPNCGKKRRPRPVLLRLSPTPSHEVKMAGVFREAALSLAEHDGPSARSCNVKKSRMPVLQAQITPFGQIHENNAYNRQTNDLAKLAKKPLGPRPYGSELLINRGGFADHNQRETLLIETGYNRSVRSNGAPYPKLGSPSPSVESSYGSNCHSSHGVPLVIPLPTIRQTNGKAINTWLSQVVESSVADAPKATSTLQQRVAKTAELYPTLPMSSASSTELNLSSPSKISKHGAILPSTSSNKENTPPGPSLSPSRIPIPQSSPNSIFSFPHSLSTHRFPLSQPPRRQEKPASSAQLSPRTLFTLAPKRKRAGVGFVGSSTILLETSFPIYGEESTAMLPDLSPHVERHRKGKGPKKDRCASYWDEDIWSGKDSPCTNAQGWREEDNLPHNEWEKDGKDLHHHQDTVEEKISGERKRSSGI